MRNAWLFLLAAVLAAGCGGGAGGGPVAVVMETSKGPVRLELFPDKAPRSVENFLAYADSGFYEGTVFHRVIPRFMIQGGGFDARLKEKPTREPIRNEASNGLLNERGTIAMARTNDPNSATSQFYINLVNNRHLDGAYAVFGRVTAGMEVVDAIAALETRDLGGAFTNIPIEDVVITSVKRE
jgi:peptidyl-prolyl cis-trans isomerase A (cyclophilin A)